MRRRLHDLRLYFKSRPLFAARLAAPRLALTLPFRARERMVTLDFTSGRRLALACGAWRLLPGACRLDAIGAQLEILADAKHVRLDGLSLYSPLASRAEAKYYKEVFIDDCYRLRDRDLAERVVVDIGAYVGDSAMAFARHGATVHAIEPSAACVRCIRRNAEANGLAERVAVHPVGLAERSEAVELDGDLLNFVEGVGYTLERLPRHVDILKIDCEGAEYYLLEDPRFLDHLRPQEIRMEYHRGARTMLDRLAAAGYAANVLSEEPNGRVGLIEAHDRRRG